MGSAQTQSQLWGARAKDYAAIQEGVFNELFQAVANAVITKANLTLLDIGCGSGIFLQIAAQKGAQVSGFDATEPLLAIARERVPSSDFRNGEMEDLPYPNQTFDVVTAFNAIQFADNPVQALSEAGRVARKGAPVVIATFAKREFVETAEILGPVAALSPPPTPGTPGPFALAADGALEDLATQSGLLPIELHEIDTLWTYPDQKTALRGFLSSAPSVKAAQHVGEEKVSQTIITALAPFQTPSGGYQLKNKARYLIAQA